MIMGNIYAERVESLRDMLERKGIDALVITGSDPHSSEYPAPRWKQVEWISGFTGEAGDIVITLDHAGLWTDTRYFIQANKQLSGTGIVLHKTRIPEQVLIPEWLAENDLYTVAVDGKSQNVSSVRALREAFAKAGKEENLNIIDIPDVLDSFWTDRPEIPQTPIITLGEEIAGESRPHKISRIRKFLMGNNLDGILLTSLEEIAWTLNVRASDIAFNPVCISYLLISMDSVKWYVKKDALNQFDSETEDSFYELKADEVEIMDYDDIELALNGLDLEGEDGSVASEENSWQLFVDTSSLNFNLYNILVQSDMDIQIVEGTSPVALFKAVKNETEIEEMRQTHIDDGLAMENFLFWLEKTMEKATSDSEITEWDAAVKLDSLRAEIPGYKGNSFETISAYGPNAALPHYLTLPQGSSTLKPQGLYLVDSGGQYMTGTTDITRTVPMGPCTDMEKEDYTLVLKGAIRLAKAIFPKGTAGCQLDVLARNPLWQAQRNFGHGTGHGVGFFLCVHEGPQDIRQNFNSQAILPGMITSDEPGIYRENSYGIRHENLVLCTDAGTNEFGQWLRFETLTLCHIDTAPIVTELLDREELEWLNDYNAKVYETLSDKLSGEVSEWLYEKTRPLV